MKILSFLILIKLLVFNLVYSQTTNTKSIFLQETATKNVLSPVFTSEQKNKILYLLSASDLTSDFDFKNLGIDAILDSTKNSCILFLRNFENSLVWNSTFSILDSSDDFSSFYRDYTNPVAILGIKNFKDKVFLYNSEILNEPEEKGVFVFFNVEDGKKLPFELKIRVNNEHIDPFFYCLSNINKQLNFVLLIRKFGMLKINEDEVDVEDGLVLVKCRIDTVTNKILIENQKRIAEIASENTLFRIGEVSLNNNDVIMYWNRESEVEVNFFSKEETTKIPSIKDYTFLYDSNLDFTKYINIGLQQLSGNMYYPKLNDNNQIFWPLVKESTEIPNYNHAQFLRVYSTSGDLLKEELITSRDITKIVTNHISIEFDDSKNTYLVFEEKDETNEKLVDLNIIKYDQYLRKSIFTSNNYEREKFQFNVDYCSDNIVYLLYRTEDTLFDFEKGLIRDSLNRKGLALASIQLFPDLTNIQEQEPNNAQESYSINYIGSKDILQIRPKNNEEFSLTVFTVNGNQIERIERTNGDVYIDTREYSSGSYLVKVKDKTQTQSYKFVIQR